MMRKIKATSVVELCRMVEKLKEKTGRAGGLS
jgi:hypothetical protein